MYKKSFLALVVAGLVGAMPCKAEMLELQATDNLQQTTSALLASVHTQLKKSQKQFSDLTRADRNLPYLLPDEKPAISHNHKDTGARLVLAIHNKCRSLGNDINILKQARAALTVATISPEHTKAAYQHLGNLGCVICHQLPDSEPALLLQAEGTKYSRSTLTTPAYFFSVHSNQ